MSLMKMRRRMLAAGLAACQLWMCTSGVYAAEDVFAGVDAVAEDSEVVQTADEYVTEDDLYEEADDESFFESLFGGDDEYVDEEGIFDEAPQATVAGSTFIKITGKYSLGNGNSVLKKINKIRESAYKKAIVTPKGDKLTLDDFVELRWSSELEEAARVRAAENAVMASPQRPNGKGCYTVVTSMTTNECRAYSKKGVKDALKAIEAQKDNINTNKSYDEYAKIYDPEMTHVGLACFKPTGDKYYSIVLILGRGSNTLDESFNKETGKVNQNVEIAPEFSIKLLKGNPVFKNSLESIYVGNKRKLSAKVELTENKLGNTVIFKKKKVIVSSGIAWKSSREDLAVVDSDGWVEAIAPGRSTVSATLGDKKGSVSINVKDKITASPTQVGVSFTGMVGKDQDAGTIRIDYKNAVTYKKKAVTKKQLGVKVDLSDLTSLYGIPKSAITIKYTFKNHKKVFVDTSETRNSKRPYFYIQLKLNKDKAKKAKLTDNQIKKLSDTIDSINKKIKNSDANKCYFYINPKHT